MAARSVRLRYTIAAVVLTLLAAWATYHLKYAVRDREIEFVHLRAQLETSRKAMQLQRADLAYLTRPERLVGQAGQLNMTPGRPPQPAPPRAPGGLGGAAQEDAGPRRPPGRRHPDRPRRPAAASTLAA